MSIGNIILLFEIPKEKGQNWLSWKFSPSTNIIAKLLLFVFTLDATREIDVAVKALNAPTLDEMKSTTPSTSAPDSIMCVFNEDLLSLSVKQFIADCVQSFLIGIPSRGMSTLLANYVTLLAPNVARETKKGAAISMDELCKKVRRRKNWRVSSSNEF